MAESFLVRINMLELRCRLSNLQSRAMTNGDVFEWLLEKGFTIRAAGWCGTAAALKLLEPGEIIVSERIG